MTPNEILRQEFDEVRAGIPENIKSDMMYEVVGLGDLHPVPFELDVIDAISVGPVTTYTHVAYPTRTYYDEGCAAFKLIKIMQKVIDRDKPTRVYWRCEPEIVEHEDFDKYRKMYKGYVRFSSSPDS